MFGKSKEELQKEKQKKKELYVFLYDKYVDAVKITGSGMHSDKAGEKKILNELKGFWNKHKEIYGADLSLKQPYQKDFVDLFHAIVESLTPFSKKEEFNESIKKHRKKSIELAEKKIRYLKKIFG